MKRTVLALGLLLLVLASPLAAQTVQVALFHEGMAEGDPSLRFLAYLIDGCLGELFEAGRIGTNAAARPSSREAFDSLDSDLAEKDAYVDLVVAILVSYEANRAMPRCSYRVMRPGEKKALSTGAIDGPTPASASPSDIEKAYFQLGSALMKACLKAF